MQTGASCARLVRLSARVMAHSAPCADLASGGRVSTCRGFRSEPYRVVSGHLVLGGGCRGGGIALLFV
jgi:hypothetical protein